MKQNSNGKSPTLSPAQWFVKPRRIKGGRDIVPPGHEPAGIKPATGAVWTLILAMVWQSPASAVWGFRLAAPRRET
ncbi:MAG: hypothetical protein AXA67_01500 [Methylothermaceae bacteria B42]|nr:MAG: hypothetical protein AXA67_01500 [Methylothermaceae bacteria B42]HHJ39046.1 hypothetical protein [Methylothermaceae bacterium]